MNQSQLIRRGLGEEVINPYVVQPNGNMGDEVRIVRNPTGEDWRGLVERAIRKGSEIRWIVNFNMVSMQHDLYVWAGPVAHFEVIANLGLNDRATQGTVRSPVYKDTWDFAPVRATDGFVVFLYMGSNEDLRIAKERFSQLFTILTGDEAGIARRL